MFRGLTRREHAIGVGLLVLLAGGVGVREWMNQPRYETAIFGDAIHHPPGQLRLDPNDEPRLSELVVGGRIDINAASAALLEELPGIGPVRAASIVAWREENGPFARIEDLTRVSGIGDKTLDRLRSSITVGPPPTSFDGGDPALQGLIADMAPAPSLGNGLLAPNQRPSAPSPVDPANRPVRVNYATEAELQALSGIGPALARRIVEDRARRGPFRSPDDLQRVSGIGPVTVNRNRHRIVVN